MTELWLPSAIKYLSDVKHTVERQIFDTRLWNVCVFLETTTNLNNRIE